MAIRAAGPLVGEGFRSVLIFMFSLRSEPPLEATDRFYLIDTVALIGTLKHQLESDALLPGRFTKSCFLSSTGPGNMNHEWGSVLWIHMLRESRILS